MTPKEDAFVVNLIARTPLDGLLPVAAGTCTLTEITPAAITSIAPYRGQEKALSAALKTAHGVTFPAPNRTSAKGDTLCIWSGRGQAMLLGVADDGLAAHAALTDQSGGWGVMRLSGTRAEDVLARLVPVDLRAQVFPVGQTARTQLFHVACSITRSGADAFDIMVMRSVCASVVHDIHIAMTSVAAQS